MSKIENFLHFLKIIFCNFRNGFPKQVAAQTILRAINEHFKSIETNKTKSTVDQVIFVLYDTESVNIYTSELGKLSI